MKRIIYSIFLVFFITLSVKAQNPREKLRTFKVAFITQELDLSPEEAQKFWPIYNAYNKKKAALRKKMGEEIHQKIKEKGKENLSEKEARLLLDNYMAIKAKEN
ncbi:MAG: hypothetical protein JKZ03_06660 [Flavobacteriaceae bacterium]|nr:hypothetical protein [Flavobacteriaceae bacterium]